MGLSMLVIPLVIVILVVSIVPSVTSSASITGLLAPALGENIKTHCSHMQLHHLLGRYR